MHVIVTDGTSCPGQGRALTAPAIFTAGVQLADIVKVRSRTGQCYCTSLIGEHVGKRYAA